MKSVLVLLQALAFGPAVGHSGELDLSRQAACASKIQSTVAIQIISSNIENIETTRTDEGGPYRRQVFVCSQDGADFANCEVIQVGGFQLRYEPGHIDADEYGWVKYPDVDVLNEIGDMLEAMKSYEEASQHCPDK